MQYTVDSEGAPGDADRRVGPGAEKGSQGDERAADALGSHDGYAGKGNNWRWRKAKVNL